jgi:DNA modification methylase
VSTLNTIANTDALTYLRSLPDGCANCCVTSPPYFGLRDYGIPPTHWPAVEYSPMAGLAPVLVPAMDACLGLEPTPDAFVGHIVAVFREVRRAMRKDGTLWLNFGDCYAGSWGAQSRGDFYPGTLDSVNQNYSISARQIKAAPHTTNTGSLKRTPGLKPKDLVGMPWRVAFALQADGWWLRSDVVWAKPNPMPESVTDRPTKAHEYVFLLSKSERYFYDAEAAKEPATGNAHERGDGVNPKAKSFGPNSGVMKKHCGNPPQDRRPLDKQSGHGRRHEGFNERWKCKQNESFSAAVCGLVSSRNARSVWTIATAPFPEAHFATFPEELAKRCIRAGTSERGCCPECGAPLVRMVERLRTLDGIPCATLPPMRSISKSAPSSAQGVSHGRTGSISQYNGFQPTCRCGHTETAPCVVLEPFCGAATVPLVATALGRSWLACELNPAYVEMGNRRLEREVGLLMEAGAWLE